MDPAEQCLKAAELIKSKPASLVGNDIFFIDLASESKLVALQRCYYQQTPKSSRIPHDKFLKAATESKSNACMQLVLKQSCHSIANYNSVCDRTNTARHMLN